MPIGSTSPVGFANDALEFRAKWDDTGNLPARGLRTSAAERGGDLVSPSIMLIVGLLLAAALRDIWSPVNLRRAPRP